MLKLGIRIEKKRSTLSKHCLINLLCTSRAYSSNPKSFSSNRRTPSNVKELHSKGET